MVVLFLVGSLVLQCHFDRREDEVRTQWRNPPRKKYNVCLRIPPWGLRRRRQGTPSGKWAGGGEPPRASGPARVCLCRSYSKGFLGGEPPRASGPARVRFVPFLQQGISRLSLEMTTCVFGFTMSFRPERGQSPNAVEKSPAEESRRQAFCRGMMGLMLFIVGVSRLNAN